MEKAFVAVNSRSTVKWLEMAARCCLLHSFAIQMFLRGPFRCPPYVGTRLDQVAGGRWLHYLALVSRRTAGRARQRSPHMAHGAWSRHRIRPGQNTSPSAGRRTATEPGRFRHIVGAARTGPGGPKMNQAHSDEWPRAWRAPPWPARPSPGLAQPNAWPRAPP